VTDIPEIKPLRKIRSFVRREGRLTKGQERALRELFPVYGLTPAENSTLQFVQIFTNDHPVHLEIGIGDGHTLVSMATQYPQHNYLGIEVHRPGIGNALLQIDKTGLRNVRLICDDAVEVLKHHIADQTLVAVYIFFPDPWHKTRHHKRRLIQPEFVNLLRAKLQPGARLHMATDWQGYAEHMLQVMTEAEGFTNLAGAGHYSDKPDYRPLTKFEQRGLRLGHGVWDLVFSRD
jgi:tRNA (guanine-N7-)-methyltransferase